MKYLLMIVLLTAGVITSDRPSHSSAAESVYVRTNQVGYVAAEQKVALALTNQNLSNQTFRIAKNLLLCSWKRS